MRGKLGCLPALRPSWGLLTGCFGLVMRPRALQGGVEVEATTVAPVHEVGEQVAQRFFRIRAGGFAERPQCGLSPFGAIAVHVLRVGRQCAIAGCGAAVSGILAGPGGGFGRLAFGGGDDRFHKVSPFHIEAASCSLACGPIPQALKGVGHSILVFARNAAGRGKCVIDPPTPTCLPKPHVHRSFSAGGWRRQEAQAGAALATGACIVAI